MHFSRLVTSILAGHLVLSIPQAWAGIHSCLLDGGGGPTAATGPKDTRLCGVEKIIAGMRSTYPSKVEETIMSGDGSAPGEDCRGYSAIKTKNGWEHERAGTVNGAEKLVAYNSDIKPLPGNKGTGTIKDASSFHDECINPKKVKTTDACVFWSVNHGENQTRAGGKPSSKILYYTPVTHTVNAKPGLSTSEFRSKLDQRKCGAQRFILNNCFSGGMHETIYADDGRVIKNRCGASANPSWSVARTGTVPGEGIKEAGKTSYRQNMEYPFANGVTEALANKKCLNASTNCSPSLDDAVFFAQLNPQLSDLPTSSSDHFLEGHFAEKTGLLRDQMVQLKLRAQHGEENFGCIENNSLSQFWSTSGAAEIKDVVDAAGPKAVKNPSELFDPSGSKPPSLSWVTEDNAMKAKNVSEQDREFAKSDLTRMYQQVMKYEDWMCGEFWKDTCGKLTGIERNKFARQKWKEEYGNMTTELGKQILDLSKRKADPKTSNSELDSIMAQKTALEAKLGELMDKNHGYNRYENLRNKLGNAMELYKTAPAEKIADYLTLRKCERAPFYSAGSEVKNEV
ncbi:MAG TPA: hypothetical protein VNJ08_10265 [Bacteriovoracaceae bacterium]|nr:hypothetical protein [Bacteriovoracaceae bacterium]